MFDYRSLAASVRPDNDDERRARAVAAAQDRERLVVELEETRRELSLMRAERDAAIASHDGARAELRAVRAELDRRSITLAG